MSNTDNHLKPLVIFTLLTCSIGINAADSDAEILKRIRPIGTVNVKEAIEAKPVTVAVQPKAATPIKPPTPVAVPSVSIGQKTYDGICFACHAVGAANSPKFADKAAWAPRIAKGMEALLTSSIKGTAAGMPPRGGCGTCSDEDLKAAVEYMVSKAK